MGSFEYLEKLVDTDTLASVIKQASKKNDEE
jgi:hypothetical protein